MRMRKSRPNCTGIQNTCAVSEHAVFTRLVQGKTKIRRQPPAIEPKANAEKGTAIMKMSILSSRTAQADHQVTLGGKIRPGIKVLTRKAEANAKAAQLYSDGVARRLKYCEIEKQIQDATGIEHPMYPRNTAFFNVSASDFGMPEIATKIVEMYGDIRPEQSDVKQLYRFPVVFHSDDLHDIYPNRLKRFGGDPGYESHYGEDGERYCRYLPAVTSEQLAEQKAKRHKRAPRREHVIRGKCDPGSCNEYLQGQCRFRGRLHFYIPGIPTTGLLAMETTSEYAAETIWADLERIHRAFGYLPKSNPNKPGAFIFYITKVLEQRTFFDEHGKKQVGLQWVPKLQADIDIGTLLTKGVSPQLGMATTPVAWLSPPKGMPEAQVLPGTTNAESPRQLPGVVQINASLDPHDQLQQAMELMELDEEDVGCYLDLKLGLDWIDNEAKILSGVKLLCDLSRVGNVCAGHLIQISNQVHDLGIPQPDFLNYAAAKYGRGFTSKVDCLLALRQHLDELQDFGPGVAAAEIRSQLDQTSQPA